jgi:UDP-N-acetylmuramate--alanine ligase
MELDHIHRVYLIGVGGIGMSGLARYFVKRGCIVCGYDKIETNLTDDLRHEGIPITCEDHIDSIPLSFQEPDPGTLIIYTPAIPKDSAILNYFKTKHFKLKKRAEVLGIISQKMFTIAVAGTHGKTTTSCIIAHILKDSGYDCSAFLGGISNNYHSNILFGKNNVLVVEADEYDRSFLTLHPDIAVITSMDADHLDIYGDENQLMESFRLFTSQLKPEGHLIYRSGLQLNHVQGAISYAVNETADIQALNIHIKDGKFVFNFKNTTHTIEDILFTLPGLHNIENALAAIEVALILGIPADKIKQALASFKGVKRRFEYVVKTDRHIYIDDYAHHPEELRACIKAVKRLYPDKKLTTIFQPHLFTRTRDFADEFVEVLSMVDELIILDIYPARELPIEGINSEMLLKKIDLTRKYKYEKKEAVKFVQDQQPELLLTVGAGDIDTLINPLKNALQHA